MRWQTTVMLVVLVAVAIPAAAYDFPLSPEAIRDAYFLGKEDAAKRDAFFEKYTKRLPLPGTGPHVASIQLETPFAVIAEHTAHAGPNYLAPDAASEYVGKPGVFRVHVRIDLTTSYGPLAGSKDGATRLRSPDFWRDFTVRLIQGKEIGARSVTGRPIYSQGDGAELVGANVDLVFDAARIQNTDATVEVVAPDGQHVAATFDLGTLR